MNPESLDEKTNKKSIRIFSITYPSEEPKGGDVDYTNALSQILKAEQGITAEHYTLDSDKIRELGIPEINKLNIPQMVHNIISPSDYSKDTNSNNRRRGIVNKIIQNISSKINKEKETPILNLQLRLPQTGALIFPPDLNKFKTSGIGVIVTCHEYLQYKHLNLERNQKLVDEYLKAADKVIFFNQQDRDAAIASVGTTYADNLRNKSGLSAVPPTIRVTGDLKPTQNRPGNILFFGLIRNRKGFEFAIPLAQELKKEGKGRKIIIAGNPMRQEISIPLEYLQKVCDLPIKFRLGTDKKGLEENELAGVFNEAKYAMVFDNFKGFSRNSSAAISLLANGLILFTNQGATTPACVLNGGENKGSVIFIDNDPAQAFGCIKDIEKDKINETREKIDSFLNKYCSPEAIVSDFTNLLNSITVQDVPFVSRSSSEWKEVEPLTLGLEPKILESIMKSKGETKEQLIKAQQVLQLLELIHPKNNADTGYSPIIRFCSDEINKSINVFQQEPNYVDEDEMVDDEDITENEDTIIIDENTSAVIDVIHDHFFKDLKLCEINLELISNKKGYGKRFNEFFIPPLSQNSTMVDFFSGGSSDMDKFLYESSDELDIQSIFTNLIKQYEDFSSNVQESSSSSLSYLASSSSVNSSNYSVAQYPQQNNPSTNAKSNFSQASMFTNINTKDESESENEDIFQTKPQKHPRDIITNQLEQTEKTNKVQRESSNIPQTESQNHSGGTTTQTTTISGVKVSITKIELLYI